MSEGGFAEHERAQLQRWAQLSYSERLQWLWEAKLFAQRALAAAKARSAPSPDASTSETTCETPQRGAEGPIGAPGRAVQRDAGGGGPYDAFTELRVEM